MVYKISVFVSSSYVPSYFIHSLKYIAQMYFSLVFETFNSRALHPASLTVPQKNPMSTFVWIILWDPAGQWTMTSNFSQIAPDEIVNHPEVVLIYCESEWNGQAMGVKWPQEDSG